MVGMHGNCQLYYCQLCLPERVELKMRLARPLGASRFETVAEFRGRNKTCDFQHEAACPAILQFTGNMSGGMLVVTGGSLDNSNNGMADTDSS
jgi:hypothetical protein